MSDRKYRHRGYQDDDRDREPKLQKPRQSGPRTYDDGPRGRGLGAPTTVSFRCARCGRDLVNVSVEMDATFVLQLHLLRHRRPFRVSQGAPGTGGEQDQGQRVRAFPTKNSARSRTQVFGGWQRWEWGQQWRRTEGPTGGVRRPLQEEVILAPGRATRRGARMTDEESWRPQAAASFLEVSFSSPL